MTRRVGCRRKPTLARELGFDAEYVEAVPLVDRPGIRFADQARIHPRRYLAGVAKAFVALGGRIHEHSAAEEFCDEPRAVKVNGHTVSVRGSWSSPRTIRWSGSAGSRAPRSFRRSSRSTRAT